MVNILLVDDHKIICQGIESLFSKISDYIVKISYNSLDAIEKTKTYFLDVIVMDINMSTFDDIDIATQLKKICPEVKIVALSRSSDIYIVSEMFRAGADAFVLKNDSFEDLLQAVQTVLQGKEYISPQLSSQLARTYYKPAQTSLSHRETEILCLLALGNNVKTIAEDLCISPKTVESHRRNLMIKLDLHNLADLTRYAIRLNLIQP